jgi:F-type H+-transporting ATPase subunit gamma
VLADLAAAAQSDPDVGANPLLAQREEKHIELLFFTSDKGLAGAFNSNLIKASVRFYQDHPDAEINLVLLGRKGRDFYKKRNSKILAEHVNVLNKATYADAAAIARATVERYKNGEIDSVYLLNNEFKSVILQRLSVKKLMPVKLPEKPVEHDTIFEQPPLEMLERLLPRFIEVEIYRSMLETSAAEHAARMTAMDAASNNAKEVIETLTLNMNRIRQAAITKEIIEVVSGAAAAEE